MTAPRDAIWEAVLDDVWDVYVTQLPNGKGLLTVRDNRYAGTVILSRQVDFLHEPRFGADVDDIDAWMTAAEAAVDKLGRAE